MRLLYVGDTASPHFRAWPEHFASAGHEVHVWHLARTPPGAPIDGVSAHPPSRVMQTKLPRAWVAASPALKRLCREVRPDLLHSHLVVPSGDVVERAKLDIPHVATAWGSEVLLAPRRGRSLIRRVAERADLLTAPSRDLLAELERYGGDPARMRWVPWGVSREWGGLAEGLWPAEAAAALGLPEDRPLLLSHRGVRPVYRQDVFLRAVERVRGQEPKALGLIVTGTATRESTAELKELAGRLGVEESVRFLDPLPHDRMALLYRSAAVCVSVPESDGAPISVLEALSLGTPTVVSDLPWVQEPVLRNARVTVVPVGDHEALAAAMLRLIREPSEADSRANIALVARDLDRATIFDGVGREYEALAARARRRATRGGQ